MDTIACTFGLSVDRRPRKCVGCGWEFSYSYATRHWTKCSLCYWKERYERAEPLEGLLRRRDEITDCLAKLGPELCHLDEARMRRRAEHTRMSGWKKLWWALWGAPKDPILVEIERNIYQLNSDRNRLERDLSSLQGKIQFIKKARKRFLELQVARANAQHRLELLLERQRRFSEESFRDGEMAFNRDLFCIQGKDYRRGNTIDNYFRNIISDAVLSAFGCMCVQCGMSRHLTFDHYGLTKNEGGNFVLVARDRTSFRLNIVTCPQ